MSFDLYFYKHKSSKISEADVAAYLTENIVFNNSEYEKQWSYENPDTGVYFIIEWHEQNTDPDEIEAFESFADFTYLHFYFYINFYSPKYFGLETFPIIDKLIEELDLYVLNPQDLISPDAPHKFGKGIISQNWVFSNGKVSASPHEGFSLEYMTPERSDYMWWYQLHKNELEAFVTEDIFIPSIFILKRKEDNILYTACSWTTHIPLVLPAVDYIIIQKKQKKLFKTIEETGVVSYKQVIEKLGSYFTDFAFEVPNLRILRQREADRMSKEFNHLEILASISEFGAGVARDSFVNTPQVLPV